MEDYIPMAIEKNDIGRTISKDTTKAVHQNVYSSPIYYIRLPPQPYVFVPNVGYISQPPQPVSQFVNLPINLVANGKPSTIYQWAGNADDFSSPTFVSQKPSKSQHQSDATIHKLPGQFLFNGKPDDVFVLRDSYNSLYADALQNFYP
ncbi:hypothetical protein BDFB_007615 [Asbolus verrucosus]|uniref:Uncharacterized protein n=1 Tax=Asbolus verrucosus TaxID=1661398 RepID=A0A482WBH7_ASBVE|nr:hypothetical protein BDFB_007615 [Asbolus verrucosus]